MAFLVDGFQTQILFFILPSVPFREKEVTPPDMDGGGEIDVTTMRNVAVRTKAPKFLLGYGDLKLTVQWDPVGYGTAPGNAFSIQGRLINRNGLISVTFPDTSAISFYGWLDKFVPAAMKEGEFPTAEMTIHVSNLGVAGGNNVAGGLTGRAGTATLESAILYAPGPGI